MSPRGTKKAVAAPVTTAQRLRTVVKSCRDIMRKDKGLNGDLDRLPMLTWIMFLKFLDDLERVRKDEATLEGRPFRETIDAPYRWRDWNPPNSGGATTDGLHNAMTGDGSLRSSAKTRPCGPMASEVRVSSPICAHWREQGRRSNAVT